MVNYYKYLPVSKEDESWGLCVLNAGCNSIQAEEPYPPQGHPAHHYFDWRRGRVLQEYQLIYITRGEGVFESKSMGRVDVKGGTVFILFPNEWHRFKPKKEKGWDEYWVGFKGEAIDRLQEASFFLPGNSLIDIGLQENIINTLKTIIDYTKQETAGYQSVISGAVMYLLGQVYSLTRQNVFHAEDRIENIVNKACILLRENFENDVSIEQIASDMHIGYSRFRKIFKAYTGMAPGQYLMQLKIEKAKLLLRDKSRLIKEISDQLHFDNSFYFSKLFKLKTGVSPGQYRKEILSYFDSK